MVRSSSSTTRHEQLLEAQICIGKKRDGGQEVGENNPWYELH
jgi:hypothetical protein